MLQEDLGNCEVWKHFALEPLWVVRQRQRRPQKQHLAILAILACPSRMASELFLHDPPYRLLLLPAQHGALLQRLWALRRLLDSEWMVEALLMQRADCAWDSMLA